MAFMWRHRNISYTLLEKGCYTPIWGNKIDRSNFRASIGLQLTRNVPATIPKWNPTLPWPDFQFNAKWGRRNPKRSLAFTLWQVWMNNCIFFSIITNCSDNDSSNPYTYYQWSACTCPSGHVAICCCWSPGPDSCFRQMQHPEACCHWNFGARQVHGGSSLCVYCWQQNVKHYMLFHIYFQLNLTISVRHDWLFGNSPFISSLPSQRASNTEVHIFTVVNL